MISSIPPVWDDYLERLPQSAEALLQSFASDLVAKLKSEVIGPFAWRVLAQSLSIWQRLAKADEKVSLEVDKFCILLWKCAEKIFWAEKQLSLKPLDMEKLLCNLVSRLMDVKQLPWASIFYRLLLARLTKQTKEFESFSANVEIELFGSSVIPAPIIPLTKQLRSHFLLVLQTQMIWLRLVSLTLNPDIELLQSGMFDTGGITSWLKVISDDKVALQKNVESFLHYLRRLSDSPSIKAPPVIDITCHLFKNLCEASASIGPDISPMFYKNLFHYATHYESQMLNPLLELLPSICSLPDGSRILSHLSSLSDSVSSLLLGASGLSEHDKIIITLVYLCSGKNMTSQIDFHPPSVIKLVPSIELWLSQYLGRFIASNRPIPAKFALALLRFLSMLECAHHTQTLNVMDVLIRCSVSVADVEDSSDLFPWILKVSRRFLDFGSAKGALDKVRDCFLTVTKYVISKNLHFFYPICIDVVLMLPGNQMTDSLLDCLGVLVTKSGLQGSSSTSQIMELVQFCCSNWSSSRAATLIAALPVCHQADALLIYFDKCDLRGIPILLKVFDSHGSQTDGLRTLFSMCLKKQSPVQSPSMSGNADIDRIVTSLFIPSSQIPNLSLRLLRSAYADAKCQFDSLIVQIKQASTCLKLCQCVADLMLIIDTLVRLTKQAGSYRLFKYYIKAGTHYSDYFKLGKWNEYFTGMSLVVQNHVMAIEPLIPQNFRIIRNIAAQDNNAVGSILEDCHSIAELEDRVNYSLSRSNAKGILDLINVNRIAAAGSIKETDIESLLNANESEMSSNSVCLYADQYHNLMYMGFRSHPIFHNQPVVLQLPTKIPLATLKLRLNDWYEENKKSLFEHIPQCDRSSAEFKRAWWQQRHNLENQLGSLVLEIQNAVFGDASDIVHLLLDGLFVSSSSNQCSLSESLDFGALKELLERNEQLRSMFPDFLTLIGVQNSSSFLRGLKWKNIPDANNPFVSFPNTALNTLILELDRELHPIPWEAIPLMKPWSVLRSWSSCGAFSGSQSKLNTIGALLNPGGDLVSTEALISELLAESPAVNPLFKGSSPPSEVLLNALQSVDAYMYFGHGSGEAYLPCSELSKLPKACCSTFLFGCSSGRLKEYGGGFLSDGPLLSYLNAHAPLVLANLWDVTDKDIDKLTVAFLKSLKISELTPVLCPVGCAESLKTSRQVCLLPLLNGAAPVIYINKQ